MQHMVVVFNAHFCFYLQLTHILVKTVLHPPLDSYTHTHTVIPTSIVLEAYYINTHSCFSPPQSHSPTSLALVMQHETKTYDIKKKKQEE